MPEESGFYPQGEGTQPQSSPPLNSTQAPANPAIVNPAISEQPSQQPGPSVQAPAEKKKAGILLIPIILAVVVLVIAAVLVIFPAALPINLGLTESNFTGAANTNGGTGVLEVIDCDTNIDCFRGAVNESKLAKVHYTAKADFFFLMEQTTVSYLEIKGWEKGNAVFYIQNENSSTTYNKEVTQNTIDAANAMNAALKGRDGNCVFTKENLAAMLGQWAQGNYSTSDWQSAEDCNGNYFETFVLDANAGVNSNALDQNSSCVENWSCGSWSQCVEGQTGEVRVCTETNNCGTIENKPLDFRPCQNQTAATQGTQNTCSTNADCSVSCTNCLSSKQSCAQFAEILDTGMHTYDTCVECSENSQCKTGYECSSEFKCVASVASSNGDLPDYLGCSQKSDCTAACANCTSGTLNCLDLGRRSSSTYNYTNYAHYYTCGECDIFNSAGQCKTGYECSTGACEPNLETRCRAEVCANCVSGLEKFSGTETSGSCYDCDTNSDCVMGYFCSYGDCVPA